MSSSLYRSYMLPHLSFPTLRFFLWNNFLFDGILLHSTVIIILRVSCGLNKILLKIINLFFRNPRVVMCLQNSLHLNWIKSFVKNCGICRNPWMECYKIFIITFEVIMLLINGKNASSNKWQLQSVFNLAILLSLLGSSLPSPLFPGFEVLRFFLSSFDWCKPLDLDLVLSEV